ncbi:MAG: cobalamin biosynthesis bifunctional protein CbiET, partial [Clostridiales bacterium]|nr:cobalamin biosynthesis bifunctional protein CbiET [Clostridiales bacterium]
AIALESAATALQCFRAHGIEPQLLQLAAARGRLAGELHLMMGQNPVYLLSGGTADE